MALLHEGSNYNISEKPNILLNAVTRAVPKRLLMHVYTHLIYVEPKVDNYSILHWN